MKNGLEMVQDNMKAVLASFQRLTQQEVLVGIPAVKASRDSGGMTNAALGYIHETGSPAANIPARPFLRPGIRDAKDKIAKYFRQAGDAALAGDAERVTRAMGAAGQSAASAAQARIRAGIPPALKPGTISNRRRRSKGSSYRRKATTAAEVTPLIDTGQLLRSITFVVQKARA